MPTASNFFAMDAPRRRYRAPSSSPGDSGTVDAADRAYRLKIFVYALSGGAVGFMAGRFAAGAVGGLVGFVIGTAFVYTVTAVLVRSGAAAAGQLYHPSGSSTPIVREYSQAQSLGARGLYEQAIVAYEAAAAEFPDDPEPCFRVARLYARELRRYDEAVAWFRRARAVPHLEPGLELVATQEIAEIFIYKLNDRRRALPELARLAERFRATPAATWAKEQLAAEREDLAREIRGEPPPG